MSDGRLRGKLLNLGERFIGFDRVIDAESRRARKSESEKSDVLFSRISSLESGVHTEVRSRAEANRRFQSEIESFSDNIFETLQNRIGKRLERLIAELDALETRCKTLERGKQQFKGELPSKLQVDTAALVKTIVDLRSRLNEDIKLWRAREEAMSRRMELSIRNILVDVEKFECMEANVINHVKSDMKSMDDTKLSRNDSLISQISNIRQSIQLEEEQRKYSDSRIMEAIHTYTGVLQKGLEQVINAR